MMEDASCVAGSVVEAPWQRQRLPKSGKGRGSRASSRLFSGPKVPCSAAQERVVLPYRYGVQGIRNVKKNPESSATLSGLEWLKIGGDSRLAAPSHWPAALG